MIDLHRLLYATISDYQSAERIRRDDWSFDAWDHLAHKIGHKNPSTLRKMCEPRTNGNGAKLGYDEAIIVMNETNDYRLLTLMQERLKELRQKRDRQLSLFATPKREVDGL